MTKTIFALVGMLLFSTLTATPQSKPAAPKTINGGVVNGKALALPKPDYPAAAMAVKASGSVSVQVLIDENGNVETATAVSGHPLLRQTAEQAARSAKFSPTTLSGQPVKVSGVITYNFIPAQADAPSNEEKLEVMGIGAFLTISRYAPLDEEWQVLGESFKPRFPKVGAEIANLFRSINNETSKEKRSEVLDKIIALIEGELKGEDKWQFEFGKAFAELMFELQFFAGESTVVVNETAVMSGLLKMKNMLTTASPDFPPDVLKKLQEVTKYADKQKLNLDESKNLVELVMETLKTISPDPDK
jgi:TonB family protein